MVVEERVCIHLGARFVEVAGEVEGMALVWCLVLVVWPLQEELKRAVVRRRHLVWRVVVEDGRWIDRSCRGGMVVVAAALLLLLVVERDDRIMAAGMRRLFVDEEMVLWDPCSSV